MNLKKQKGFTLIELMIVVAIIGILASIAIPQFSAFRVKAYNSAAVSDMHSMRLGEELIYTDYTSYGASVPGTVQTAAIQATPAGTSITDKGFIALGLLGAAAPILTSSGVTAHAASDVSWDGTAAGAKASYYILTTQHLKGDKQYVSEEGSAIFQKGIATNTAFSVPITTPDNTVQAGSANQFIPIN